MVSPIKWNKMKMQSLISITYGKKFQKGIASFPSNIPAGNFNATCSLKRHNNFLEIQRFLLCYEEHANISGRNYVDEILLLIAELSVSYKSYYNREQSRE